MAHNFVALKAGVDAAKFSQDAMMAKDTDYVPAARKADVLGSTKLAGPGETVEVTIKVPAKAGVYPYLCTFPGHFAARHEGRPHRQVTRSTMLPGRCAGQHPLLCAARHQRFLANPALRTRAHSSRTSRRPIMGFRDMDAGESPDRNDSRPPSDADEGLRRMLTWVFVVLVLTVLFALLAVEFTIRWFA